MFLKIDDSVLKYFVTLYPSNLTKSVVLQNLCTRKILTEKGHWFPECKDNQDTVTRKCKNNYSGLTKHLSLHSEVIQFETR